MVLFDVCYNDTMDQNEITRSAETFGLDNKPSPASSPAHPRRNRINRMREARDCSKFLDRLVKSWELQDSKVTGLVAMMESGWSLEALGVPDSMWEVFRAKLHQVQTAEEYFVWAIAQMKTSGGKDFKAALETVARRCHRFRQILEKTLHLIEEEDAFDWISTEDMSIALKFHNDRLDKMPKNLGVGRKTTERPETPWEKQLDRMVAKTRELVDANAAQGKYPTLHRSLSALEAEVRNIYSPAPKKAAA